MTEGLLVMLAFRKSFLSHEGDNLIVRTFCDDAHFTAYNSVVLTK